MTGTLVDVFKEALFARLMPAFSETTLDAIVQFKANRADFLSIYFQHAFYAMLGACLAYAILFVIGHRMRAISERSGNEEQKARIDAMGRSFRGWAALLLVLAPTPLGTVIVLAAGFLRVRIWIFALIVCAAELFWRLSPLSANLAS